MTMALMNLWSRSMGIVTGSPEVMARRIGGMMNPAAAWSPAGALEMQSMLIEKMEATSESCWALFRGALSMNSLPSWDASMWLLPERMTDKLVGAANQAVMPVSDRVAANVERLRNA